MTLEAQVSALESAHFNAQTLAALSNSQRVLRQIHKDLDITQPHAILDDMREQIENVQEVSDAISTPLYGNTVDEVSLDIAAVLLSIILCTDQLCSRMNYYRNWPSSSRRPWMNG